MSVDVKGPNVRFSSVRTRNRVYAGVKEPSSERANAYFGLFRMLRRRYKKIRVNVLQSRRYS